ncbi:tetratricopeptide repeat protein [Planococcus sp. CP5-4]|uniref:tetratricopeptide repeat protein n=1 Tax=unclassified Planococcus (in: firmicutes) TaxID=2662419 RepID=UPI001C2102D4|nr:MULTISPECIES: tetratricopeptide repeat protein [unclassified Planococcus (in: firmicutes)]MBU9674958.1 tetratricopeptide repeat protein [Planococcus sp. CP5-4_YE]MBV0908421.1 tetratricopeptide repeat protein [Planococcus sp. CP5-4_UN]MBW6062635.1 tetratricopeptide repeat protein [Planococcus sp. CP5-4]
MSNQVSQLLSRGITLKRSGDLEGAQKCYIEALNIEPTNLEIFLSIGKTAHLQKNQNLAVKCYLAFNHLMISPIEKAIQQNDLQVPLKNFYDSMPAHSLNSLPKHSAFTIFTDKNTPKHIAHSLIDLSESALETNPHLRPYSKIYHALISGDGSYNNVLQDLKLSAENHMAIDEDIYIPFGRNFLIDEIQWDKIESTNVLEIYFS